MSMSKIYFNSSKWNEIKKPKRICILTNQLVEEKKKHRERTRNWRLNDVIRSNQKKIHQKILRVCVCWCVSVYNKLHIKYRLNITVLSNRCSNFHLKKRNDFPVNHSVKMRPDRILKWEKGVNARHHSTLERSLCVMALTWCWGMLHWIDLFVSIVEAVE